MNFDLSDEQVLLRESVAGYLARNYSFDARRAAARDAGWRPDIWQSFAQELGLFGAALPEDVGGFGGGPVETMVISEEFGRALVLEPYLESVVMGAALLRACPDAADLLGSIIDGSAIVAPALYEASRRFNLKNPATKAEGSGKEVVLNGTKCAVAAAPIATHFVVSAMDSSDEPGLFLVTADAAGVERRDYALIDGRRAADLTFTGTPALRIGAGEQGAAAQIEEAADHAIAALCAEAVGVMDALLKSTVEYARQREQFGVPIGSFQVLQHRMVDMLTHLERARSLSIMATISLGLEPAERGRAVSAAKAYISKALKLVGESAIQIHGGIGTTEELAVSHYFKRATVMQGQFGTGSFHLQRMAELESPVSQ